MHSSKFIAIVLAFFICGCQCNNNDIVRVNFMEHNDKLLNCRQLEYALLDTKAKLALIHKQYDRMDAYSENPLCIVNTEAAIQKSRQSAEARTLYLSNLYMKKGCSKSEKPNAKTPDVKIKEPSDDHLVKIPLS